jgi:hypothetical protein
MVDGGKALHGGNTAHGTLGLQVEHLRACRRKQHRREDCGLQQLVKSRRGGTAPLFRRCHTARLCGKLAALETHRLRARQTGLVVKVVFA